MTEPNPYDGALTLADLDRFIAAHRAAVPAPIAELKVTKEQLEQIRRTVPVVQADVGSSSVIALLGIPVILVDTVEESTLFDMTWESLVRRLGGRA